MTGRIRVRVKSTVGLGRPVEIEAETTMTIREVKERVATENVIDPNTMAIEFNGRVLNDDQTLKGAGVTDGSVLSAGPRNIEGGGRPLSLALEQRLRVEYKLLQEEGIDLRPDGSNPLHWVGFINGQDKWKEKKFKI